MSSTPLPPTLKGEVLVAITLASIFLMFASPPPKALLCAFEFEFICW